MNHPEDPHPPPSSSNIKFLENPFHICKDYRLQITEDVSKRHPTLRLHSRNKSRNKSETLKASETLDLDSEVRSLLQHFRTEQEDRNAYLLLQNQAEAYKQLQHQAAERKRVNALTRSQVTTSDNLSLTRLQKPSSPFTMTVRPVIPKIESLVLPLSSQIRAPELAYLENDDSGSENADNDNDQDEDESGKEDDEPTDVGDEEANGSLGVRKLSSGRTSKKPSKLIAESGSKTAFTGSLERLKHISNSKRKPSVTAKMYVPSFDVKPKVPTRMFGSRQRAGHSRKDEESVTIHTLYSNEELRRLYRRPVIASDAHSDTEIIDLAQSTDLDDTTSKAPVIDLVDDDTGPGERVWDGADSRKRPLQSSSAPIQNNSSSNSSDMSGAKKRKMQNENANHVLPTVFIPLMCPTPKSLAWTNIAYNVRCDDEPVLRYVPYFGDDDVTGVDVSAYDLVPGELEPEVSSEAEEVTIIHLINKYGLAAHGQLEASAATATSTTSSSSSSVVAATGTSAAVVGGDGSTGVSDIQYRLQGPSKYDHDTMLSLGLAKGIQKLVPEVMAALERVLGLSSSQILKTYERATEGLRMRFRARSSMEDELERRRIRDLGHPSLVDLDNPVPPVFTHAESLVGSGGLGLSKSRLYSELVENYRQLLCRRCFTYDCKNHFIAQPPPRVQQDPLPPFPCPVPGLSLPTDPPVSGQKKATRPIKRKGGAMESAVAAVTESKTGNNSLPQQAGKLSFIDSFGQSITAPAKVAPLSLSSLAVRTTTAVKEEESKESHRSQSNATEEAMDSVTQVTQQSTQEPPPFMLYRNLLLPTEAAVPTATTSLSTLSNTAAVKKSSKKSSKADESTKKRAENEDIPWTDVEVALLEKLVQYNSRITIEMMATMLGTRTPAEVEAFLVQQALKKEEESKLTAAQGGSLVACLPCAPAAKSTSSSSSKARGNSVKFEASESRDDVISVHSSDSADHHSPVPGIKDMPPSSPSSIKKNVRFRSLMQLRKVGPRKEYEPCDHAGPCTPATCTCLQTTGFCEKFCACPRECKQRFSGCRCKKGVCRTNMCPCYAAQRECDPDLCGLCGVSIHPSFWADVKKHFDEHGSNSGDPDSSNIPTVEGFKMCNNSNIRRNLAKRVYIGRSTIHGWGAFLAEKAERNEFIMEYVGEIITQDEADRRGKIYDKIDSSFLFNLNEEVVIDATRKGNKAKFVNHSKEPNCHSRIMQINGDHKICLFAKKAIAAGEELSFDYSYSEDHAIKWSHGQAPRRGAAGVHSSSSSAAVLKQSNS